MQSSEEYAKQLQAEFDAEAGDQDDEEEENEQRRRRNRGKKGRRKQRRDESNDLDFRDNQDIELMQ